MRRQRRREHGDRAQPARQAAAHGDVPPAGAVLPSHRRQFRLTRTSSYRFFTNGGRGSRSNCLDEHISPCGWPSVTAGSFVAHLDENNYELAFNLGIVNGIQKLIQIRHFGSDTGPVFACRRHAGNFTRF